MPFVRCDDLASAVTTSNKCSFFFSCLLVCEPFLYIADTTFYLYRFYSWWFKSEDFVCFEDEVFLLFLFFFLKFLALFESCEGEGQKKQEDIVAIGEFFLWSFYCLIFHDIDDYIRSDRKSLTVNYLQTRIRSIEFSWYSRIKKKGRERERDPGI